MGPHQIGSHSQHIEKLIPAGKVYWSDNHSDQCSGHWRHQVDMTIIMCSSSLPIIYKLTDGTAMAWGPRFELLMRVAVTRVRESRGPFMHLGRVAAVAWPRPVTPRPMQGHHRQESARLHPSAPLYINHSHGCYCEAEFHWLRDNCRRGNLHNVSQNSQLSTIINAPKTVYIGKISVLHLQQSSTHATTRHPYGNHENCIGN